MINRVLIANRGEVAVRIIRACWEMGIETVAIYSTEDKNSMHVTLADFSVCVGSARAEDSYLNIYNIISAAKVYKVDAIHPGYGFLSESPKFADICKKTNIIFIGPDANIIQLMGNKTQAIKFVKKINIPTIPGSNGRIISVSDGMKVAEKIGYPVLIKAASGGGGKGIRRVNNSTEFESAYNICLIEAKRSFGDDEVYVEKFIENPRHIEVQVVGDGQGGVLILGDRDCSLQRNNQKVIEEAPANILTEEVRYKMQEYSRLLTKECKYKGLGTIEFLLDNYNNYYFMEMNTRLQVEHPITEMITNVDLVKEQINLAMGKTLSLSQDEVKITGHSMECRINSENPTKKFMASFGTIENINFPGGNGVRVDTDIYINKKVTPTYDSNIAKVIVYGRDRSECIIKMKRALSELVITGIDTNIDFLIQLLDNELIIKNTYDTQIIKELLDSDYFNKIFKEESVCF